MQEVGQGLRELALIENMGVRGDRGVKKWEKLWKKFLVREIDAYRY
jgi:hypothetical protein